jgi:hypothetical protein
MELPDPKRKRISDFYREEFERHKDRLECQRTFFAEKTYEEIEGILNRIITEIDRISQVDNFEELASHLLYRIDIVTNLSSSKVNPNYRIH